MKTGRPKGTKQSPEAIEKIRRASVARWKDPAYRARHLAYLLEAAKAGGAAYSKRCRERLPKMGTRARDQYEKVRSILGLAAARASLIKSAETDRAGAP